jgi:hypothetical protein
VSDRPSFGGYADPYEFAYPYTLLQVVSLVGLVVGGVGALALAAALRGGEVSVAIGPVALLGLFVAFLLTLVAHEAVHGLVARALGYRVSFGVTRLGRLLFAAYAATLGQPVSRRDLALVAVAPLVVVTLGCAVGLALGPDRLVGPLVVALVVNTSGVAGDLYLLYYVARLPRGSLLYDLSVDEMLVYEPTG